MMRRSKPMTSTVREDGEVRLDRERETLEKRLKTMQFIS